VHYSEAIPGVLGTVADVGENGVGLRSLFDDGGSGAVCDRSFVGMNRYQNPLQQTYYWATLAAF
jgi:hypothetical protein